MFVKVAIVFASAVFLLGGMSDAVRPFPGSRQEKRLWQQFLDNPNSTASWSARTRSAVRECITVKLSEEDPISRKFYKDHVCVYETPPNANKKFCQNFRQKQPRYQVLMVSLNELKKLRADITDMQATFYLFRDQIASRQVHFATKDTYSFYDCELIGTSWKANSLHNMYQEYVPRVPSGNNKGKYQIYHGCPPVGELGQPLDGQTHVFPNDC